ncbi:uncharacterized protein ISCGN_023143 [Ixodes scapularis]
MPREAHVFLKERDCKTLKSMVEAADRFLEAQQQKNLSSFRDDPKVASSNRGSSDQSTFSKPKCFLCGRLGHKAPQCRSGYKQKIPSCPICRREGHDAKDCPKKRQDRPQISCFVDPVSDKSTVTSSVHTTEQLNPPPIQDGETGLISAVHEQTRLIGANNMPVVRGLLNQRPVSVLRDTGSNTVIVRSSLVEDANLTGKTGVVILVNGAPLQLPEARVKLCSPYFTGDLLVKCMDAPLYDVIVGNVEGARRADEPDLNWNGQKMQPISEGEMTDTQKDSIDMSNMLTKMSQEKPRSWDRFLAPLLFAYREVPQASLGFSPFELIYGRHIRGPLTILKEVWTRDELGTSLKTTYGFVLDLRSRLEKTMELAHKSLASAKRYQKKMYDKKSGKRDLKVGDRALLLIPSKKNKLQLQWKGPYRVVRKRNEADYEVDLGHATKLFHINMLKRYEEREAAGAAEQVSSVIAIEDTSDQPLPCLDLKSAEGVKQVALADDLSRKQREDITDVLEKHAKIFSDVPGRTNLLECKLQLTTDEPIRTPQYPIPFSMERVIEKEEYEFSVEYIKGVDNVGGDYLSRV